MPLQARNPRVHLPGDLQRWNWVLSELLGFPPLDAPRQNIKDLHRLVFFWWGRGDNSPHVLLNWALPVSQVTWHHCFYGESVCKHQNHKNDKKLKKAEWLSSTWVKLSCKVLSWIFIVFIPIFSRPENSWAHDRLSSCHCDKQAGWARALPATAFSILHTE